MKKLILAEKPDMAKKIAKSLGGTSQSRDGYISTGVVDVTYCFGHLVVLKTPEEVDEKYKSWRLNTSVFDFNEIPLKSSDNAGAKKQLKQVIALIKSGEYDEIINACDADREGELIFRNVIEFSKAKKLNISRMWIKSMTNEELKKSFDERQSSKLYDNLGESAKARSYADYFIGLGGTRAMTSVNGVVTTVGRVQTPTLRMIVDRQREIDSFIPETYYKLYATTEAFNGEHCDGKNFDVRFSKVEDVERVKQQCGLGEAKITKVEGEELQEEPNKLYSLSDLQIEMNRKHSFSAQETLEIAQKLYEEHKLTTYPRTDETTLSRDFAEQISEVVKSLPIFTESCKKIVENNWKLNERVIANKEEIGAHEALTPTLNASNMNAIENLNEKERKVFEAIIIRFLENFFPNAVWEKQEIIFERNGVEFFTEFKSNISKGFLEVSSSNVKSEEIPSLKKGDKISIEKLESPKKETLPPKRYTEASLLKAMKKPNVENSDKEILKEVEGIGTEATRAGIIDGLKKKGYVTVDKKYFVPTEKATSLIDQMPSDLLKSVKLTANLEKQLKEVSQGKKKMDEVMSGIKKIMNDFVEECGKVTPNKTSSSNQETKGKKLSSCPSCGDDIISREKGAFCKNENCKVAIFRTSLQNVFGLKTISDEQIKQLLEKGETKDKVSLTSKKSGKTFEAFLTYTFDEKKEFPNNVFMKF